ncbi:MAG: DUF3596 domain-containing protein [Porticoccaceae bacterium]
MGTRENPKKHPGITPRSNSILIDFSYQGKRCRETIRVKPTATSLKAMSDKRSSVLYEISMGTFNYAKHFPESKHALNYCKTPGSIVSVKTALKSWLVRNHKQWQATTYKDYNQIIYSHLIPEFGSYYLTEVTPTIIKDWIASRNCSNKRINNILSPLRQMYNDAYEEELIDKHPMGRMKNLKTAAREPRPLNSTEINKVLESVEGSIKNQFQFAIWSGLRTSELIALKWEDIDWKNNRFYVRRARVKNIDKTTKTTSGIRTVELQEQALNALLDQRNITSPDGHVFIDPQTNLPYKNDQAIRRKYWTPALARAKVTYRTPYETRHTYASLLLSRGEIPMWVASQMGHKDCSMLIKTYGRWIPRSGATGSILQAN